MCRHLKVKVRFQIFLHSVVFVQMYCCCIRFLESVCVWRGSLSSDINGMDPDVVVSTRPFRNIGLSKAAQTHRLRKLRTPAKCRECDSYVYFQGAECEEVRGPAEYRCAACEASYWWLDRVQHLLLCSQCFLACHKRCLETLAIQCGHKKLQGRLQLFGREFTQVASCASDGIPFIITKCISEIERRALKMKVRKRISK